MSTTQDQVPPADDACIAPTRLARAVGLLIWSATGSVLAGAITLWGIQVRDDTARAESSAMLSDPFVRDVFLGAVFVATLWTWVWALALIPRACSLRGLTVVALVELAVQGLLAFALPLRFLLIGAALLPPCGFFGVAVLRRSPATGTQ